QPPLGETTATVRHRYRGPYSHKSRAPARRSVLVRASLPRMNVNGTDDGRARQAGLDDRMGWTTERLPRPRRSVDRPLNECNQCFAVIERRRCNGRHQWPVRNPWEMQWRCDEYRRQRKNWIIRVIEHALSAC